METSSQKIIHDLELIHGEISEYLANYSKIVRRSNSGNGFIYLGGEYGFEQLPKEAVSIQDKLFKRFNNISQIISILLIDSVDLHIKEFETCKETITSFITQDDRTYIQNIQQVIQKTRKNFDDIKDVIINLYPNSKNDPILIPDTNALYANTEIEKWEFETFDKFIVALTPSVLSDLDKHKIEHRNESVRNKALKLINKIKEYRRRGKLSEMVHVVKDKIWIFTIANEPDFQKTLGWLDKENDDDRLVAETLEIIRKYGDRAVIVITSDINLQNKLEMANLSFLEPPEI